MLANIKFGKLNPEAKIPTKRLEDMGLDIYACFKEDYIFFVPNQTIIVPTGIVSACDSNYGFFLKERGSTGTKGIAQRSGVIDSGYRGEWLVPLTNVSTKVIAISKLDETTTRKEVASKTGRTDVFVYPYSKAIAQAVVIPVPELNIEEWSAEDIQAISSLRGDGKLGSSEK